MYQLKNRIMTYPWGSREGFTREIGIPNPDQSPQAEMWMGAHPKGSSLAVTKDGEIPLLEILKENPTLILGDYYVWEYGESLPYLFKVLSAAQPLSIQVHPPLKGAIAGFLAEEDKGIPLTAPQRNYKDPNHKPEMMLALTPFYGLCGFRPAEEIQADLEALNMGDSEEMKTLLKALEKGGHKGLIKALLSFTQPQGQRLITQVKTACGDREEELFRWVLKIHEFFPGDTGMLYPLILNLVYLEPGEALFLSPGILHAYLEGTGLELMANSDNVLRCGLTSKHIDPEELLKHTRFEPYLPRPLPMEIEGPLTTYKPPVREFLLSRVDLEGSWQMTNIPGPVICLLTEGEARFSNPEGSITLKKGDSLLLIPSDGPVKITGTGVIYRAAVQH